MLNVEKIVKGWTQKIGYPSRVIERGKVGTVDIVHGQVGVIDHKKNGAERIEDQVTGSVGAQQQKDNENKVVDQMEILKMGAQKMGEDVEI